MSNNLPPKFYWNEQRQVNVYDIPGVRYLPCMPVVGSSHAVTRIENGTFIQYVDQLEDAYIFKLVEKPEIQFVVPNNFYPYLWKVKKARSGNRGWR